MNTTGIWFERTVLQTALERGHLEIVHLLRQYGVC